MKSYVCFELNDMNAFGSLSEIEYNNEALHKMNWSLIVMSHGSLIYSTNSRKKLLDGSSWSFFHKEMNL